MQQTTLVSRAGLKARGITYCNQHLIRLEREGLFPRRVRVGAARVAWLASELDAWLAQKVAERDPAGTRAA